MAAARWTATREISKPKLNRTRLGYPFYSDFWLACFQLLFYVIHRDSWLSSFIHSFSCCFGLKNWSLFYQIQVSNWNQDRLVVAVILTTGGHFTDPLTLERLSFHDSWGKIGCPRKLGQWSLCFADHSDFHIWEFVNRGIYWKKYLYHFRIRKFNSKWWNCK